MTEIEQLPALVFDTMCLSHFTLADRLDVLRDLLVGHPCHTTHVVREELRTGGERHPVLRDALVLDWLQIERFDTLAEHGKLTEVNVENLIDALKETGMRLPCSGSEYGDWARGRGLL
jgi:hypothetical protein